MDKILVTRSSMPPMEEYIEEIKSLWESHWLTNMGEYHRQFAAQLKDYMGAPNLELFVNGHMALELTLQAMDLGEGEVITTPFTFASTTHAIVRNGLKPVFCDIREDDYTLDAAKIKERITERTKAIVPVHVYGNVCQVEEIEKIAREYGLKVLYDAAHAFGESYKGSGIGTFGDASMFSFHATKVYHTVEGGAVCYRDEAYGLKLFRLKNFGIRNEETVDGVGANAKMNEFSAAMGICNLRHIDEEIAKRKKVVERYRSHLKDVPGIQLNTVRGEVDSNYAYFPVVIDETIFGATRDTISSALSAEGIFSRKYFYPLTSTFACYQGQFDVAETPVALRISNRVLTLPLYADLSMEAVDRICGIILRSGQK